MSASLRSKVIHLASNHPDLREHLLPLVKDAAGGKISIGAREIQKGYYNISDGYHKLNDAVRSHPATSGDQKLADAVKALKTALDSLDSALKPYAWD